VQSTFSWPLLSLVSYRLSASFTVSSSGDSGVSRFSRAASSVACRSLISLSSFSMSSYMGTPTVKYCGSICCTTWNIRCMQSCMYDAHSTVLTLRFLPSFFMVSLWSFISCTDQLGIVRNEPISARLAQTIMQQWMVMQGRLLTPDGMTSYLLMSLCHLALCLLFAVIKGTRNNHWSLRYLGLARPGRKFCTDGP
jgi:hypothetical protein